MSEFVEQFRAAFPKPDHHHLRLMADLVTELDQNAQQSGKGFVAFTEDENIDTASLEYMMAQRILRMFMFLPGAGNISVEKIVSEGAVWLDGFALGYLFALNRTDR